MRSSDWSSDVSYDLPIIGITGASGAGTSTAVRAFVQLFEQLRINGALVEGDAFHAYDRAQLRVTLERARIRGENFSLFSPGANLLERLEALLREYGQPGTGMFSHLLHRAAQAAAAGQAHGPFTERERPAPATDHRAKAACRARGCQYATRP